MKDKFIQLRKYIGFLGFLFPLSLILSGRYVIGIDLQESISDYYHTPLKPLFVMIMSIICTFLFTYDGYDKTDNILTNISAFSGLGLTIFPTSIKTDLYCSVYEFQVLHLLFAFVFFVSLAFISMMLFTKTNVMLPTRRKMTRNSVYISSGLIMIFCVVMIAFGFLGVVNYGRYYVFFYEWVGLAAFGLSWVTKGELILKDNVKQKR